MIIKTIRLRLQVHQIKVNLFLFFILNDNYFCRKWVLQSKRF